MPVASIIFAALLLTKPQPLSALKPGLDAKVRAFRGRMGYWLKDLSTGEDIGFDADDRFPSASTIKTAVMVEVFRQIEAGKLSWTDKIRVPDERNDSMWLSYVKPGIEVNIEGLVNLMMNVSDNTATVMLADRVGINNIEKTMNSFGLDNTACTIHVKPDNPRLVKIRAAFANMGMTTPKQMGSIFELISTRKVASADACDRMVRILSHQYWDDFLESTVPPGIATFGKVGALNRSRSSVILVNGKRPYILSIYTDNDKDQSWKDDNEAHLVIRDIGSTVWNRLHPDQPYWPGRGQWKYFPTGAGVE